MVSVPTFSGAPAIPATRQSLVLPYMRGPLHIPRRDLVLAASDSLNLLVTVVESDDPAAGAIELTGGLGGPFVRMNIWADALPLRWDYGFSHLRHARLIYAVDGTISTDAPGSFDLFVPAAAFAGWPARCGWTMQLIYDSGVQSETLSYGTLVMRWSPQRTITATPILADDGTPVVTDDDFLVEA